MIIYCKGNLDQIKNFAWSIGTTLGICEEVPIISKIKEKIIDSSASNNSQRSDAGWIVLSTILVVLFIFIVIFYYFPGVRYIFSAPRDQYNTNTTINSSKVLNEFAPKFDTLIHDKAGDMTAAEISRITKAQGERSGINRALQNNLLNKKEIKKDEDN